uniref:Uncharacterized protein n=1 Tax=Marseillevirus sp. TaxID=2809551 RepID=A0AA96ER53_9VIRU|nr:hypothetical protein MarFTMF_086 [Marseillevirus sp.]
MNRKQKYMFVRRECGKRHLYILRNFEAIPSRILFERTYTFVSGLCFNRPLEFRN